MVTRFQPGESNLASGSPPQSGQTVATNAVKDETDRRKRLGGTIDGVRDLGVREEVCCIVIW